jgi:hypothetical protein
MAENNQSEQPTPNLEKPDFYRPSEENRRELARQWIRKAQGDKTLFDDEDKNARSSH